MIAAAFIPAAANRASAYDATDDPVMIVTGQTEGAEAGRNIALIDINHDGKADLVVGAPGDSTGGMNAGKVMVYLGDDTSSAPDAEIVGAEGDRFGFSVARAGDVNSDGIDDLVVGAPDRDAGDVDNGAVYIIFGVEDVGDLPALASGADVIIEGEVSRAQLGYSVSSAGDTDMDGFDDVIVGAPFAESGAAHIIFGGDPIGGALDKTFTGSDVGEQFGFSVAGGVNLDGYSSPDVVVGAPRSDDGTGSARVILNPAKAVPKETVLAGVAEGDRFGTSIALLDFNDDIYGDVAIGSPNADGVGAVYLHYGSSSPGKFDRNHDIKLSIGEQGDMFGVSVASGDPRTDDIGDLLVGAPMNDAAGVNAGRAYVFYGNVSADTVPDVVVDGSEAGSCFGLSVASGAVSSADFDGDGAADFAVGAPRNGGADEGAAYLYLGIIVIVPENPTLFGYVLDAVDGSPMGNALVTMESAAFSDSARTIANGSYGIATPISLPPGLYWINASSSEYFTSSEQLELEPDNRYNVSFEIDRWPVVQGVISDGNATGALEDALVEVRDASDTLLDDLTTDSSGEYEFVLNYEGDITITVTKEFYFDGLIELTVEGSEEYTEDLTLNHYPTLIVSIKDTEDSPIEEVAIAVSIDGEIMATNETDDAGRAVIMVPGTGHAYVNSSKAGYVSNSTEVDLEINKLEEVDEIMDAQPSITGTVKDSFFLSPVFDAIVDLYESGSSEVLGTETTDSYGSYTFAAVEEGTYDLRVTAAGYVREYRPSVEVVADETTIEDFWLDIDLLPPTSEISDPQPGLVCTTSEVIIYANASDPDGNDILELMLFYSHGGKPYAQWDDADIEEPYVFAFDASDAEGPGIYEFYTIAVDCAGSTEVTPTVNDTWVIMSYGAPESEVNALDPYQGSETFTVEVSASDPFGVDYVELWYSYDGGAFELVGPDSQSPYEWEFSAADGDGEYAFYSILVNDLGQVEPQPEEPDATTVVDTIEPTVEITSPADEAITSSEDVTVEYTTDGTGTAIASVERRVDSGSWESAGATSTVVEALTEGAHTVDIRVTDQAGHTATDSVGFTVDMGPPMVTITSPDDGAVLDADSVTVEWTVTDQDADVEVRLDGGEWQATTDDSMTFSDLDDGEHTVDVRATGLTGSSSTASVTFIVSTDNTAPTVSITSPANGSSHASTSVTVNWSASDGDGSGIALVEIKLDAGSFAPVTTNTRTFTNLSEGAHNVTIRVTDSADNVGEATVTFMVDTMAPTVTITSPEVGWETTESAVTITWTCSDVGCGVNRIEVRLDDGSYVSVGLVSERTFEELATGEHTVDVRVFDKAGNSNEASVTFTVAEDGGGVSGLLIGVVLLAVILALAAVMLMRRKKAGSPPPPME